MADGAGLRYANKTNCKTLVRRHSGAAKKNGKKKCKQSEKKRNGKIPNGNKQRSPDFAWEQNGKNTHSRYKLQDIKEKQGQKRPPPPPSVNKAN